MEYRALIAGERQATHAVEPVIAPYDGRVVGHTPLCRAENAERAIKEAARWLSTGKWPRWRRAEALDHAAASLEDPTRREDFARTIALEAAKPITAARTEVDRCSSTFRFAAAACRQLAGEEVPVDSAVAGEGKWATTLRVPVGVVGAISPFNFPLNLAAHKVAPALAAGAPVVLKPARQTPLTALKLGELLLDACGVPEGAIQVVPGPGSVIGAALVNSNRVSLISFTGSPQTGWAIKQQAPRKKTLLELGNSTPVIIEPDGSWRQAAQKAAVAATTHAGQSCISVQRALVHTDIVEDFTATLAEATQALVVGDPLDERTQVSSLIDRANTDRVQTWIQEAADGGATIVSGGALRDDGALEPTVLANVTNDMKVCREEVFGPVVSVSAYSELEEAITAANDTKYGLQAGLFTRDLATIRRAAHELDFGGVIVNEMPTWRADQMPYGGVGESGNTREGPAYAVAEMTETRVVVIDDP